MARQVWDEYSWFGVSFLLYSAWTASHRAYSMYSTNEQLSFLTSIIWSSSLISHSKSAYLKCTRPNIPDNIVPGNHPQNPPVAILLVARTRDDILHSQSSFAVGYSVTFSPQDEEDKSPKSF